MFLNHKNNSAKGQDSWSINEVLKMLFYSISLFIHVLMEGQLILVVIENINFVYCGRSFDKLADRIAKETSHVCTIKSCYE